jgi:Tol biopolymer transport system component
MDRMSTIDLDRQLTDWYRSADVDDIPVGLLEDVFDVTRRARQRRGALGRLSTAVSGWWQAPAILRVASRQLAYLAVVALLIVAAALAIAAVGAHRAPPPFGLAANGQIAFDRDGAIVIAGPDGAEIAEITTIPEARGPVYAPDGSRFAFYGRVAGEETIMVASADGRDPIPISSGITIDIPATETPPSWSPDSQRIVFSGLEGNRRRLFVAMADGSATQAIGDITLSSVDPAWSPDGAWIAFHGFREAEDLAAGNYRTNAGLYLIRPDGQGQILLVKGSGGDFVYRKPQWLPDPKQRVLAYAVGEPSRYDIAVFDANAMTQTVISRDPVAELWPAWSPDGSILAWAGSDNRIRVARADGTILRILPGDVEYELVWSPDGRSLVGWKGESRTLLAIMSIDGSSPTIRITLDGRSRSHWSWQRLAP